jgi:hypothetical protein
MDEMHGPPEGGSEPSALELYAETLGELRTRQPLSPQPIRK